MNKLAEAQVLVDAADVLRKTAQVVRERDSALAALNEVLLAGEVEKVASDMERRGITRGLTGSELREHIHKEASAGRLDVIKEAVAMIGTDMSFQVDSSPGGSPSSEGAAADRYLNGLAAR